MLQLNYCVVAVLYPGLFAVDNGHFQLVLNFLLTSLFREIL